MPIEDGIFLLPNCKGVYCDSPTGAWQKLCTASLSITDTSSTISSVRSYNLSCCVACIGVWTWYRAFSCSEPTQNWQPFGLLSRWIGLKLGPKWRPKCLQNPKRPSMHCASVTRESVDLFQQWNHVWKSNCNWSYNLIEFMIIHCHSFPILTLPSAQAEQSTWLGSGR